MLSIAYMRRKFHSRRFGGVVVSVLAIGPKVRELKPVPGDEVLRAMQIRSMSYFRGVANPWAARGKIFTARKHLFEV
jgi:hypothetical protein